MKKIVCLAPQSHLDLMFSPALWAQVNAEFEVWHHSEPHHLKPEDAAERIRQSEGVITGWGAGQFPRELLESSPELKIVAHTAGSPRGLFADDVVREVLLPRDFTLYTGADGMAINVVEATIGLMILAARRWPIQASSFRSGHLEGVPPRQSRFLTGARVGLVSASKVARQLLPHLQIFGCEILIYDPFLTPDAAQSLGARRVELPEMFASCDIVSLHAPDLPATRGLVTAELLATLRDGATFVNTSRGAVVDHDALLQECRSGRIFAALDVSEPEPLPRDSAFWDLPNVLLLPHTAGQGRAGYDQIGQGALQALRDCFAGQPVAGAVPLSRWETVA